MVSVGIGLPQLPTAAMRNAPPVRTLSPCLIALAGATVAALWLAAGAQALTISSVSAVKGVNLKIPSGLSPAPYTEESPWFVKTGSYQYFLSTNYSYDCASGDSLLSGSVSCDGDCGATACTALVTEDEASKYANASDIPAGTDYKRDYEGIFTAQVLKDPSGASHVVALDHGENKNDNRTGAAPGSSCDPTTQSHCYHNTVQPADNSCWTPVSDLSVYECYPDYNGFVDSSSASLPSPTANALSGWSDNGPIVWPKDGYVSAGGSKASWGVRHPSSIVANGMLYVFYLDTGSARTDVNGLPTQGGGAGIAVARSPAYDVGRPGSFETSVGGGRWAPSLPSGMSAADVGASFAQAGPKAAQILGDRRGSYYFAVARTGLDDPAYLGIENYAEPDSGSCPSGETAFKEALWESNDLLTWNDRTAIPQLTSCGTTAGAAYDAEPLRWAHFLDTAGTDENQIDPRGFYLIGTCAGCGNTGVGSVALSVRR